MAILAYYVLRRRLLRTFLSCADSPHMRQPRVPPLLQLQRRRLQHITLATNLHNRVGETQLREVEHRSVRPESFRAIVARPLGAGARRVPDQKRGDQLNRFSEVSLHAKPNDMPRQARDKHTR